MNKIKKVRILSALYLLAVFFLFLFSYTQVDLSLTLSRASLYQTIEKSFQYIGYYQRPFAAAVYCSLLILLFSFYILFLFLAKKNFISRKQIWLFIFFITIVLVFSYNSFSYDLFNYIFDARIITHYHQNPYFQKALDYPGDPMLSFMRWTHRTYPYGPVWLLVTVPLSFIGLQFFLPTFFLFKMLMATCFLGSVFLIAKIQQKINQKEELFSIILFAFNPLVLIESLVSSHNDIVMIFFAVVSFYFLVEKKYIWVFLFLLLSIGIKFATIFLLPIFLFVCFLQQKKKKIHWQQIFLISSISMIPPIILASLRSNFQPWYLLFVLPYSVFVGKKYYIIIPSIVLSLFFLLEYAPYIYYGDYNPPVPTIFFWLISFGLISSLILTLWFFCKQLFFAKVP